VSRGIAGTERGRAWIPERLRRWPTETLLVLCRPGTTKDSADEEVEIFRSSDGHT